MFKVTSWIEGFYIDMRQLGFPKVTKTLRCFFENSLQTVFDTVAIHSHSKVPDPDNCS